MTKIYFNERKWSQFLINNVECNANMLQQEYGVPLQYYRFMYFKVELVTLLFTQYTKTKANAYYFLGHYLKTCFFKYKHKNIY